jgi:hypothetical protein
MLKPGILSGPLDNFDLKCSWSTSDDQLITFVDVVYDYVTAHTLTHSALATEKVLKGACAPLSRDGDPLAGWEASRQTGRKPQHLGQSGFGLCFYYDLKITIRSRKSRLHLSSPKSFH